MYCFKRKITSVVMLAVILAPLAASVFQLVQQQYIRHRVKEQLETAALETITIPAGNLHWADKDHELLVNGKLFDVKSIRLQGSNYIITGLYDHKETTIAKNLEQQAAQHQKNTGSATALRFLMLTVFTFTQNYTAPDILAAAIKITHNGYYHQRTCSPLLAVTTPPPNRV